MKARIIAGVSALTVTASTLALSALASGTSTEKYNKPYTIKNILSDYQIFTNGNYDSDNHTVGAIAVGGTLNIDGSKGGCFGDGAIVPSYAATYKSDGTNFAKGQWYSEQGSDKFYYGTLASGSTAKDYMTKNAGYIDFSAAMSKIKAESSWIAGNSTELGSSNYVLSSKTVNVNLANYPSKNIKIPISKLTGMENINFTGVSDVKAFAKGGYTINFTGTGSLKLDFSGGNNGINIKVNNTPIINSNFLKEIFKNEQGGQIYSKGLPLVFNVPDASSVTANYLAGGLVAPNASVTLTGGHCEGNVIAASAKSDGCQTHFYPYYAVGGQRDASYPDTGSSEQTQTGAVNVTVLDDDNTPVKNAKISVVDGTGKEIKSGYTNQNGAVTFNEIPAGKVTVKISDVPDDYSVSGDSKKEVTVTTGTTPVTAKFNVQKLADTGVVTTPATTKATSVTSASTTKQSESGTSAATTKQSESGTSAATTKQSESGSSAATTKPDESEETEEQIKTGVVDEDADANYNSGNAETDTDTDELDFDDGDENGDDNAADSDEYADDVAENEDGTPDEAADNDASDKSKSQDDMNGNANNNGGSQGEGSATDGSSPLTGKAYAGISVCALLTAAAAIYIGKKKYQDNDEDDKK